MGCTTALPDRRKAILYKRDISVEPCDHGWEVLYHTDDYIMTLKTPEQAQAIAAAFADIDKDDFKERYYNIEEVDYAFPRTEEDFEFTREWFDLSKEFWKLAAEETSSFCLPLTNKYISALQYRRLPGIPK